ncbi:MAG: VanZ family protein [Ruminococcus sp.]|nr:VanZ family protein [Ruminococcus sp.]
MHNERKLYACAGKPFSTVERRYCDYLCGVTFLLAYLMQRKHCSKLRTAVAALLYFYIFNVLVTTLLMRTPYSYYRCTLEIQFVNQIFVQKDLYALSEALLNIMMFLIPSIFLPFFFKEHEALKTLCCGLGFTLFIEITQYFTRLGELQTDDLIMNFSGCLLGVLIYFTLRLTISFFKEKNSYSQVQKAS